MDDLTVVYYTNNREDERFEQRIQTRLLQQIGDLPLVSVSQKPIKFGYNLCVGEVGISSQNAFRQLQVGAKHARTRFVCPAEADFLYPDEYFQFRPPRDDVFYMALPLWVLFAQRGYGKVFCSKPRGSEAAMVVNRELLIDRIDAILANLDYWGTQDADGIRLPYLLNARQVQRDSFTLPTPIVTFKTDANMHRKTPHDVHSKTRHLEGIGSAREILEQYCGP